MQKVEIKFENQFYKAEIPQLELFTGQLAMTFHLKQGVLMKVDISKSSSGIIVQELPTVDNKEQVSV